MAGPLPAPLPPWAKALLQLAPLIEVGLQHAIDYIGEMHGGSSATPDQWRRVQWVFHNPGDADQANRAVFTWDIANITAGKIDNSWTTADYNTVEAILGNWWNAMKPYGVNGYALKERRYYVMGFTDVNYDDPNTKSKDPFLKSGTPARVFPVNTSGTGANTLPAQVAISITEKTPYPRHWGRFYFPFVSSTTLAAGGVIATTAVDAIQAATQACYQGLQDAEFFPVVPVTQIDKLPARGLLNVTQVQVDNVYDVIRRRRVHTTSYRKLGP